jgi:hypothetical protein
MQGLETVSTMDALDWDPASHQVLEFLPNLNGTMSFFDQNFISSDSANL